MKMRPDNAPLIDLTQHRRPDEGREETVTENIVAALILAALAVVITIQVFAL